MHRVYKAGAGVSRVQPLGGLGVLALAQITELTVATSGPIFNKIAVLEAIDNYGAEVRYAPRLHTSVYKMVGERECWVAGPLLVKSAVAGSSTSLSLYTCTKADGLDKIFIGGKPAESLSLRVVGGGRYGRDFDIVVKLRSLQVKGDDEEDVADKISKKRGRGGRRPRHSVTTPMAHRL